MRPGLTAGLLLVSMGLAAGRSAPIIVDLYQSMESGRDGDALTPELVSASCRGEAVRWTVNGKLWVSTKNARALPGPAATGGKSLSGREATRTWMFKDRDCRNYVECNFPGDYERITVACY